MFPREVELQVCLEGGEGSVKCLELSKRLALSSHNTRTPLYRFDCNWSMLYFRVTAWSSRGTRARECAPSMVDALMCRQSRFKVPTTPPTGRHWLINTEHSFSIIDLSQHIHAGMEAHWASDSVFPSQSPHFARIAVAQLENELL